MEKLSITTFNCKGWKPRNFPYLQKIFQSCTFLLIQEHWLFECEFQKLTNILPNSAYHALSSMRDDQLIRGRPYGGTAILYRENIDAKVTPIITTTPRICAVTVSSEKYNVLIMSIYMPYKYK